METADKMKNERIAKKDEEIGYLGGSPIVNNYKKDGQAFGGIHFDYGQTAFKTLSGDCIQIEDKNRLASVPDSFKTLVDNANDGICIIRKDMRHVYVNKKYCEITGYSDSELMKVRMMELILPDERESFQKMYQLSFYNKKTVDKNCVATVIRKDGKRCSIECSRALIIWNRKPAIQGIIRDITKNLERENMIKESNKLLSNQIENITPELISSSKKLNQQKSELIDHKLELENVNKELLQTNQAMSILARNIDRKKKEVEQKIAHTVVTKIIPIIDDLKKKKVLEKYAAELEVLSAYIKGLAPESDLYNKIIINLSATEMRIATLIKNGMSSQSIADALHISLETVKTHRKKIRRKLEIKNSGINLTSYLQSLMADC